MSFNRNSFDTEALEKLSKSFLERGETVAVAESVTSGLLQVAFASMKSASQFYQGGITAYNLGQKCRHLNVEPIHAQACDCVSETVAQEMAQEICGLFLSDWGLGITGYAVPTEESRNEVFAYYSIFYKGSLQVSEKLIPGEQDPQKIQLEFVNAMIGSLKDLLTK